LFINDNDPRVPGFPRKGFKYVKKRAVHTRLLVLCLNENGVVEV
jgi:hypothetical protein